MMFDGGTSGSDIEFVSDPGLDQNIDELDWTRRSDQKGRIRSYLIGLY